MYVAGAPSGKAAWQSNHQAKRGRMSQVSWKMDKDWEASSKQDETPSAGVRSHSVVCLAASRAHQAPIMMHATLPKCIQHVRLLQGLGEVASLGLVIEAEIHRPKTFTTFILL